MNSGHGIFYGSTKIALPRMGERNPYLVHTKSLHDTKVTVKCGFTSSFITGPYFLNKRYLKYFKPILLTHKGVMRCYRVNVILILQQRSWRKKNVIYAGWSPKSYLSPSLRVVAADIYRCTCHQPMFSNSLNSTMARPHALRFLVVRISERQHLHGTFDISFRI